MIVFEGQHVQNTWRPQTPKSDPDYPWLFANESGWMTSDTFYKWFVQWEEKTRSEDAEGNLEKRLLIYDGHLSHIWYGTLEYARAQGVTIIKLPPHTTDVLQPLDVSVFRSLKGHWGDILFDRLRTTRTRIPKTEFAALLSDQKVWAESFKEQNIKNGFRTCGIFPPDRSQYPTHRFSVNLKNRYDVWVREGKPELTAEQLDELISESKAADKADREADNRKDVTDENSRPKDAPITEMNGEKGRMVTFFVPVENPHNMVRISPSKIPSPIGKSSPFGEQALKKLDALHADKSAAESSKPAKRKRVNPFGDIVTSDDSFQKIMDDLKKKEEEDQAKKARKEAAAAAKAQKGKARAKKKTKATDDKGNKENEMLPEMEFTDSEVDEDSGDYSDDEPPEAMKWSFPPTTKHEGYVHLSELWDDLNPPSKESDIVGKFFGFIIL